MTSLLVFVAGGVGALLRHLIGEWAGDAGRIWAVAGINVVGSFALGVLLGLPMDWLSPTTRTALGVGLLGGFTTFATFSGQLATDLAEGRIARSVAYAGVSILGGLLAAIVGLRLGARLH